MKGILVIVLVLSLSGCDLFRRSVKKEDEKTEIKQEEKGERKLEVLEKSERDILVLESETDVEVTKIQADDISYNIESGDFRASGNVLILSNKKREKQSEKKDFIFEGKDSIQTDIVENKTEIKQERKTIEKEKFRFGISIWRWILLLILVIICYVVYRRIKGFFS